MTPPYLGSSPALFVLRPAALGGLPDSVSNGDRIARLKKAPAAPASTSTPVKRKPRPKKAPDDTVETPTELVVVAPVPPAPVAVVAAPVIAGPLPAPPRGPAGPPLFTGVLEMTPKGFGFLRDPSKNYASKAGDPFVPLDLLRHYKLKSGQLLSGPIFPPMRGQNGPRLGSVELIEGAPAAEFKGRQWDELTAVDPTKWLKLETGEQPLTTRVMDLFTPVGMGQRGLIVAPPRTGKTILLSHIAAAISTNYPGVHLMMLLIDERPEEVTEMKRTIKGEVIASSNDQDTLVHVRTAELVLERAKRLTEQGKDVVILLDSLTRLARAYNKHSGSGKTMSGGVDSRALEIPKRLFGSARAFEEGGTLTILGSALIETGSRMDDVIFQEFKGTGNMELVLSRTLSDKRIFPAIDLLASGTRKEERLIPPDRLERINLLRRSLLQVRKADDSMESLIKQLVKTKSNDDFLDIVGKFIK